METQVLNLFIVDDDKLTANTLQLYLKARFGSGVCISTFYDGESCLKNIEKDTHMVILDYFMKDENGLDVLKSIKTINPKTEVVILSGNEDIVIAIELFKAGAKDYVVKGIGSWKKVGNIINDSITKPIRVFIKGFFR